MAEREVLADLVSALSYQAACNVVVSSREKLEFAQDKVWAAVDAAQKLLASPPVAVQEKRDDLAMSEEWWHDLALRHAGRDWNGDSYLQSVKALVLDAMKGDQP